MFYILEKNCKDESKIRDGICCCNCNSCGSQFYGRIVQIQINGEPAMEKKKQTD